MLRRDLATVRRLAAATGAGEPAGGIRAGLRELQSRGPLFQLRVNCLSYCQFVHGHHGNEDAGMFPALRRMAPELGTTIDKLEADHRVISDLLDQVEGAARNLGDGRDAALRGRLVEALDTLSDRLLAHLAFEEEALGPVLGGQPRPRRR